ncbi:MAG TPA: response regulator [Candidatus Angelobacter sp.]|jgi:DNA-binding NtrC family response regulator
MAERPRILFVDDELAIRTTLPLILSGFGFDVVTAATVPEALQLVSSQTFDVLISDLNIGQPGDGFTVVSAMRRTHPNVPTFILTGYPAFETALEAIRQQVDDYLVKPADIEEMVEKIKSKLTGPRTEPQRIATQRLAELLDQNKSAIVQRWLAIARQDAQIASTKIPDHELTSYLPSLIEEIVTAGRGGEPTDNDLKAAAIHGKARFKQGSTIPAMIHEVRILQQILGEFIQENLLGADVSSLIPDVMRIREILQAYLEKTIREFIHARHALVESAVPGKRRSLLLLSADRELALLAEYPLKHAGYTVTRADSRREALHYLKDNFDALVISHSILGEGIAEMTDLFRQQNPNSAIVTVSKGRWQDLKVDTDHAISGEEGPEALIEAVETALTRKQLRRIK